MKYGWHATFMPKPLFGENGSGMHTHQSLFKDGRNAFYDADDQYFLSDVGKAFIAGQLKHAREISSVFAQWVNSYKRLVPGYEAPVYCAWSRRNRSALVRVPLYHPGKEQATRMELRCPDPACNPYLTFAALLQAGLEGIEKGYELPEPMEKNLYHLSPDERKRLGIEQLPGDARRGDRADRRVRAGAAHVRRAHLQPLRRDQAAGVGGLPGAGLPVGARPLHVDPLGDRAGREEHVLAVENAVLHLVDVDGVVAVAAVDRVLAAVASLDRVVAGPAEHVVLAPAAVEAVVALASLEVVDAVGSDQPVVAALAVEVIAAVVRSSPARPRGGRCRSRRRCGRRRCRRRDGRRRCHP